MTEPRMAPAHRRICNSPLPDVEVPDLPLTGYVLAGAAGQEDKPALIDGLSGQFLTYAGLESAIGSLAGGLAANGFAKGDVLALMAPNMPEYAVVFHAAATAGGKEFDLGDHGSFYAPRCGTDTDLRDKN